MLSHHRSRFRVLCGTGPHSNSKTYWLIASYSVYTAPGEKSKKSTMALLDLSRSHATSLQRRSSRSTAAEARQSAWRRAAFGLAQTFLALIGIGIGILMLRFFLVL